MIDTHTHLYLEDFANEGASAPAGADDGNRHAVQRAIAAGVDMMILPNVDATTVEPMRRLHALYPGNTRMAIGHHPTEVNGAPADEQLQYVADELALRADDYVAIGEIGIDLYWDATHRDRQMQVFERQMQWAAARSLPVIIHCRDGLSEVLEVIDGLEAVPQGVFHSFGGTAADVEAIRRRGDFYFGINGIVTFKNSRLREVLPEIGADCILLETDAPYLAPVPMRGRRNESSYLPHTAAHIASALSLPLPELLAATTASARRLFSRLPG